MRGRPTARLKVADRLKNMPASHTDTLYILSAGHSGSTLLNLMLGCHPRAVAVSELTNLPGNILHNEPCTCGQRVLTCPFWRDVAARSATQLPDILEHPRKLDLGFIDAPPSSPYRGSRAYRLGWRARRIAAYAWLIAGLALPRRFGIRFTRAIESRLVLYDAIRAASGAQVLVDASKEYLIGVATYLARPATTRLILLVREGRAVFYSNLKRGFGHAFSLRAWRNYYRNTLPLIARRVEPAHVLTVRYEDLATDPERELQRICAFAGLAWDPAMLDTASKVQHLTSGNNMRFRSDKRIKLDTAWRSELKEADRRFFERRVGTLSRRLGYE